MKVSKAEEYFVYFPLWKPHSWGKRSAAQPKTIEPERVAINRARDQKRSFWEKHRASWEDYMETLVFEAPEDKSLFEAVMSLPAKYRTVIHLFYYEDYSVARIAEILHSREGTVKSQLNRGRQLLKTKLMEAWNDDE